MSSNSYMQHPHNARTHYFYSNSVLHPIPQEGIASSDYITNPFYTGSINAGNYPPLVPLPEKPAGPRNPNYVQSFPLGGSRVSSSSPNELSQKRAPAKPQPYSGSYTSQVSTRSYSGGSSSSGGSEVLTRRDSSVPFLQQRLPSLGSFDPFNDLLNFEDGAAGYVVQNPSNTPLP